MINKPPCPKEEARCFCRISNDPLRGEGFFTCETHGTFENNEDRYKHNSYRSNKKFTPVAYPPTVEGRDAKKIFAVDIDGTIADGKFWEDNCTPKKEVIKKVNDLYKTGQAVIIYHTARHPQYYGATYGWLVEQGCYFHALEMGKLTADFYIDDRNLSIEDFMDGKS